MLPSKIDQKKVSHHETGSEANFGFGRALMPSYLGMCPPKAAFFSFRMQPLFLRGHECVVVVVVCVCVCVYICVCGGGGVGVVM